MIHLTLLYILLTVSSWYVCLMILTSERKSYTLMYLENIRTICYQRVNIIVTKVEITIQPQEKSITIIQT